MSKLFRHERNHEVFRDVQLLQSKAKAQAQLRALKAQRYQLRLATSRLERGKAKLFHDGKRARAAYSQVRKQGLTLKSIWDRL